jgi:hypothetical protein
VLEQGDQLGVTPLPMKSSSANNVIIILFTLQHTDQEINDAEVQHVENECGGQSTNSFSEEKLPPMNHMEYRRMVVEAQTMVNEAKDRQNDKSVETMGQCEDDQSRQMEIWEDNVSMVLFTGGHLEIGLYDTANIERAKKQVMKYHWSKDTLFFQNLVVPRPAKQKMSIEKIHEKIGHFGEMRTLAEVKKGFFWHAITECQKIHQDL